MLEKLIAWYAPHSCLGCATEGSLLCMACRQRLLPASGRCYRCRQLSINGRTCLNCRRSSHLYSVQALTGYDGLPKQLVGRLKFGGARAAAGIMARQLAPLLPETDVMLVHLPTATSRARQRGYDQAAVLARELSRLSGRPYLPCLARHGQHRQVGASRSQRLRQLAADFTVVRPTAVRGAHIVLVDDVLTTGASLETAAATLQAAGARRIEALVFARA